MTDDEADRRGTGPTAHDDAATPAEDAAIRRLLGSLGSRGGDGPATRIPAEVADRLDDVLAGLVAERAESPREATVSDLTERRSRRWPKVLVAAAAVSVLGVGLGNVALDGLTGGDSESLETAVTSDGGGQAAEGSTDTNRGVDPDDGGASAGDAEAAAPESSARLLSDPAAAPLLRLRADSLATDAQRLADFSMRNGAASEARTDDRTCDLPSAGAQDELYAVRLDGRPATLVFRNAEGSERRADVYLCSDAARPAASTVVEMP